MKKILVVEDDERVARVIEGLAEVSGKYAEVLVTIPEKAELEVRCYFERDKYDLVVVDGLKGSWKKVLRAVDGRAEVVLYSVDEWSLYEARKRGNKGFNKLSDTEDFIKFLRQY